MGQRMARSPSLHPDDPASAYYDPGSEVRGQTTEVSEDGPSNL